MPRSRLPIVGLAAVFAVACAPAASEPSLASNGELRIATKIDEPGIGNFTDPSGSDRAGLDIDVAKYIADKLGVRPKWEQVQSESREDMIMNNHTDLIIASYSITDERKKKVAFAGPYLIVGQDVMVRAGDESITGMDDLKNTSKKTCSAINSTSLGRLLDEFKLPTANIVKKKGYKECVAMLVSGQVDAVSTDDAILFGYANEPEFAGKVRVLGRTLSEERYGIGLARKWRKDCERLVTILQQMISDGSWQRFVERNLGQDRIGRLPQPDPEPSSCAGPR